MGAAHPSPKPTSVRERIGHQNRVVPFGRRGQKRHRTLDQFFDAANIFNRLTRQIGPTAGAFRAVRPSRHRLINRHHAGLMISRSRQIVDSLAVKLIANADFQHVSVGRYFTCTLRRNSKISCFGAFEQSHSREFHDYVHIDAGDAFSCSVRANQRIECYNANAIKT